MTNETAIELASTFEAAATAQHVGNQAEHRRLINQAADAIDQVHRREPLALPNLIGRLAAQPVVVLRADLRAAINMATHTYQRHSDTMPNLLHPRIGDLINTAAAANNAAPGHVTAWLAVDLDDLHQISRPDGYDITTEHRDLLNRWDHDAISASADTLRARSLIEEAESSDDNELIELVRPGMTEHGLSITDAIHALPEQHRVRAEELLAGMPSLLTIPQHKELNP